MVSQDPNDPNFGLETDETSPNFGLPEQPKEEGGVLSGIAAGVGRLLNPVNLVRGVLDIQPRSGLQEVLRTGRMLRDVVGGASIDETVRKEAPEIVEQQEALTGKFGAREQAAQWTGLAAQAALLAAPFVHGRLSEIAGFAKPEPVVPEVPVEPLAVEARAATTPEEVIPNAEQIQGPTRAYGDVQLPSRPEQGEIVGGEVPAPVGGEGVPTRGQGQEVQEIVPPEVTPPEEAPAPEAEPQPPAAAAPEVGKMSNEEVRGAVEAYLGKEGGPKEIGDWQEIRDDISSGMTRDQALRKYWGEKVALDQRTAAEDAARNQDFVANDERAKFAQMSPEQWKETGARATYEDALSRFTPKKGQRKPPDFEQWFQRTQAGLSDHELAIREAQLHDAPFSASAAEKYGIEIPEGYTKQGDQYIKPAPVPEAEAPTTAEPPPETPTEAAPEAAPPAPPEVPTTPIEGTPAEVPVEPKTPVETPEPVKGGAKAEVLEERPIEAPDSGESIGWEEATAHGNDWLDKGGDINKTVTDFRRTGKVNPWEMGKMRAYLQRLQASTNQAGDMLRLNPDDPTIQQQYGAALQREQAFTDSYKPMHTVASNTLASLKGSVPLDEAQAQSFTGLTRRFAEFRGRAMTPEEAVKAERITKQAEKVNGEHAQANDELYRRVDTEYGRIRTTRAAPPTLEDLGRTFGQTLKEVCGT